MASTLEDGVDIGHCPVVMPQVFRGTLVDTPAPGSLRIREDHVLVVNDEGSISHLAPAGDSNPSLLNTAEELGPHSFLLPTFTDLHIHAPQYLNAGMGLDLPLLEWLDRYTYPAEERIDADPELAAKVYTRLVERLIQAGTGCILAFGTIGVRANVILARACQDAGIRGFIGKLSMDQSPRATYGEKSVAESIQSVDEFLDEMEGLVAHLPQHERLVSPVLTPRFVPTCSDELLRGLAGISRDRNILVQSHMCESRDQMAWVESTRGKADEVVFDEAGLLTPRTIQAHVTSFPPDLINLVKERGVKVAHCPLSNAYFSDVAFPLREAMDAGVQIGLGSDIAGGYALPIQAAMREAVVVARLREGMRRQVGLGGETDLKVDWKESLYLGTRGGKSALGLGGVFEVGMEFDAQQICLAKDGQPLGMIDFIDLPASLTSSWWLEAVERWWCIGDDRNRTGMWVQGRRLK